MNKLKIFSTETQYDLAKDDFEWATVSFVEDVDEIRYMTKPEDYSTQYLTFEALEDGTFTFTKNSDSGGGMQAYLTATDFTSISYSTDNGSTWTTLTNSGIFETQNITVSNVRAGDKVLWKGISNCFTKTNGPASARCTFSSTCNYRISGNIMSLLYGDGFNTQTELPSGYTENFKLLFTYNVHLVSAQNLILPATTLTQGCYYQMFDGCTSLTTAPALPATTLAQYCYSSMFQGCTGLATAPELPATTLAGDCYFGMFWGCTNLTTAPELPATTLANYCYQNMFQGCTSLTTVPVLNATTLARGCYENMFKNCTGLTTAPELPATTLATSCYYGMFQNCSSLNHIKAMFTTEPSSSYTGNWVSGVAATGTFVKNSVATWTTTGVNGVPSGWTVQTASE